MSFAFLNPWLLAGLAALALPVLIHLVQRERPQAIPFPSLMFLRQIPYQERRLLRIRDWWLLALRCLALALIALAFARPFLSGATAPSGAGRRDVVILLDRSYSMGYAERWQQARQAALDELAKQAADDRVALIFFDRTALIAAELGATRDALRAALAAYRPGAAATDLAIALAQAGAVLEDSNAPAREIVLISDFQRSAYDAANAPRLPSGVRVRPIAILDGDVANATVTGVTMRRQATAERGDLTAISATLRNTTARALDTRVTLDVDGREQEIRPLALAANTNATVTFADIANPGQATRATVRLGADGLAADNAFHFVLNPVHTLRVLVLENATTRPNQSLYLSRALALGENPRFAVEIKSIKDLRPDDYTGRSLIIVNDTPLPGGELGERLRDFVSAGGGLLVVAADGLVGGWSGTAADFLPGTLGPRQERQGERGAAISQIDASHPLFASFSARQGGDFRAAQIWRYRRLAPTNDDVVLARYDDGTAALVERLSGAGRTLVLTTTLDTAWNDLALQPVFVPFVHRLAQYLAAYENVPAWFTVGNVVDGARQARAAGDATLAAALTQGGAVSVVSPSGARAQLTGKPALLAVTEPGFYELRRGTDSSLLVAVNVDAREAELTPLDSAAFVTDLAVSAAPAQGVPATAAPLSPRAQEERQRGWWYLLLAAGVLLIAEAMLAYRRALAPQPKPAPML